MRLLCVVALVLSSYQLCFSRPTEEEKPDLRKLTGDNSTEFFEKQFLDAIECVKEHLREGDPVAGVPPLDPWKATRVVPVEVDKEYLILDLHLTNLVVNGLLDFEVVSLHLSNTLKLETVFKVNRVALSAFYSGSGNILGLFNVYGEGNMNIELSDIEIKQSTQYRMTPLLIESYSISTHVGDGKIMVSGLFGDDDLSADLSQQASKALAPIINYYLKSTSNTIDAQLQEYINKKIGHWSFLEFLAFVSSANCASSAEKLR